MVIHTLLLLLLLLLADGDILALLPVDVVPAEVSTEAIANKKKYQNC
jgi:hypothetical protein